jgi:hypothetical protein
MIEAVERDPLRTGYELNGKEARTFTRCVHSPFGNLTGVPLLRAKKDDRVGHSRGAQLIVQQRSQKSKISPWFFENAQLHGSEVNAAEGRRDTAQLVQREVFLPEQFSLLLETEHDQSHRRRGHALQQADETVYQ